jgi:hypothetical protein
MKRLAFLNFFFFLFLQQFAQVYLHPQGMAYFKEGTSLLEKGDYHEAEKSLTIALNTLKDQNVYMKRGIARLYQEDTVGFCQDMDMAANKYFNLQASLLFNDVCCKRVDTLYFLKNMQPASKADFRYFEEIKVPKYDDETVGIFHDIKVRKEKFNTEYGRNQSNLGKNFFHTGRIESYSTEITDIVAVYEENDSIKNYLICTHYPHIKKLTKYGFVKNSMKKKIKNKYYNLKIEKNSDLTIYFEIYINKLGKITNVQVIGTYPEIDYSKDEKELQVDITNLIKQYPPIKPATFNGKSVNFIALDYVTF